jgi:hypothetical protein
VHAYVHVRPVGINVGGDRPLAHNVGGGGDRAPRPVVAEWYRALLSLPSHTDGTNELSLSQICPIAVGH